MKYLLKIALLTVGGVLLIASMVAAMRNDFGVASYFAILAFGNLILGKSE